MEKWRVQCNYFNDSYHYRVYRRIRADEPLHSGNMEYHTDYMDDKALAEQIAAKLNEELI